MDDIQQRFTKLKTQYGGEGTPQERFARLKTQFESPTPQTQLAPDIQQPEPRKPSTFENIFNQALGKPSAEFMAGIYGAAAGTARVLDNLATYISEKTGLEKGGLFENMKNQWEQDYARAKSSGLTDDDAASRALSNIYEGLGSASFEIPKLVASGPGALPIWGGLGGASKAIEEQKPILPETAKGVVTGLAFKTGLRAVSNLPRGAGEIAGGALFGGPALVEEMQKPPEERDWSRPVSEALLGIALTAQSRRIPWRDYLLDVRESFTPFNAMPRWEKQFYGPMLKELKTYPRGKAIYDQLMKMPKADRSRALRGFWNTLYEISQEKAYRKTATTPTGFSGADAEMVDKLLTALPQMPITPQVEPKQLEGGAVVPSPQQPQFRGQVPSQLVKPIYAMPGETVKALPPGRFRLPVRTEPRLERGVPSTVIKPIYQMPGQVQRQITGREEPRLITGRTAVKPIQVKPITEERRQPVKAVKKPVKEVSYRALVRQYGGLNNLGDLSGEVKRLPLFVKNNKGLTLDQMWERLKEDGYDLPTVNDLVDKLLGNEMAVSLREEPAVGITKEEAQAEEADRYEKLIQPKPVTPEQLPLGAKVKIMGEEHTVTEKTTGGVRLTDHGPDVLVDTGESIEVDRGEIKKPTVQPKPEAKLPEGKPPEKQAWEMKQVEVTSKKAEKVFPLQGKVKVENGKPIYKYSTTVKWGGGEKTFEIKTRGPLNGVQQAERLHKEVIKQALSENFPVPESVLADYPELQKEKVKTVKVKGAKHEQIVSPELLGQAKMPKKKLGAKKEVKPIEGTKGIGLFKKEEGGEQLGIEKPEEKPTKEFRIASPDDIDKRFAEEAYRGTSFSSEKRGERARQDYADHINEHYNELMKLVKSNQQKAILDEEFPKYKEGYLKRYKDYLSAQSRTMSPMITGPAKFPVARNQKRLQTVDNRYNDLKQYDKKVIASIERKLKGQGIEDAGGPVEILKKEIAEREALQKQMVDANKIIRKKISDEEKITALKELGFSQAHSKELLKPGVMGNTGFARFELTNNNARIRNKKQRLAQLERAESRSGQKVIGTYGGAVEVVNNFDEERVQITFKEMPSQELRNDLKGQGWRWSPKNKVWQRKNTNNAIWSAKRILDKHFQKPEAEKQVRVVKSETISFYDKNQALRTGKLIEKTDTGAYVGLVGKRVFVKNEQIRKPKKVRVLKTADMPTKTIQLKDLKIGDRYIDAENGEIYEVIKKNPDGTVDVQDGKKRTLSGLVEREIKGEVNDPKTLLSGMQLHPTFSPKEISQLKKSAGTQNPKKFSDYVNDYGKIPTDPKMRKEYLSTLNDIARTFRRFQKRDFGRIVGSKRVLNALNPWGSMRYALAQMEAKTATPKLYEKWMDFQGKTAVLDRKITDDFSQLFQNAGLKYDDIARHKDRQDAIKAWLFEEDPKVRRENYKKLDKKARAIADEIDKELQGETATFLRFFRWRKWYKQSRDVLERLEAEKSRLERNVATVKRIGVLEDRLKNIAKTNAPDATIEKLKRADEVYETKSRADFFKYLSGQSWGTRKHYYMSEPITDDQMEMFIESLLPGETIETGAPRTAKPGTDLKEAHTRRQKAIMKQGALLPNLYSHIHRIKMMAMLIDDIESLSDTFMSAEPSKPDIRYFKRNVKNALGFAESGRFLPRLAEIANRIFWRAYPLTWSRAAWYTFRNLHQNIALGPGQVSVLEATKALASYAKGPTELLKKNMTKYWKARISQKMPMHRHFMLLDKSQGMKQFGNKAIEVLDTVGEVIPLSDEINRIAIFPIVHRIAERNINLYKKGKINFNQLYRRLRLNLHPVQAKEIMELLNDKKYNQTIFRVAEGKTENVHFKYRTSERAGIEQERANRAFAGLYNWPRGLYEAMYQNGLSPFMRGVRDKDFNKAYTGLLSLVMTVIGMYSARELAKKILGKKTEKGAYDIIETLTGYTFGSPGLRNLLESSDEFSQIMQLTFEGEHKRAISMMGNRVAYYMPFVQDMVNIYEAENDKRGITAMRILLNGMKKDLGVNAKRTSVEYWQHIIFGTEEYPQSQEKKTTPSGSSVNVQPISIKPITVQPVSTKVVNVR